MLGNRGYILQLLQQGYRGGSKPSRWHIEQEKYSGNEQNAAGDTWLELGQVVTSKGLLPQSWSSLSHQYHNMGVNYPPSQHQLPAISPTDDPPLFPVAFHPSRPCLADNTPSRRSSQHQAPNGSRRRDTEVQRWRIQKRILNNFPSLVSQLPLIVHMALSNCSCSILEVNLGP